MYHRYELILSNFENFYTYYSLDVLLVSIFLPMAGGKSVAQCSTVSRHQNKSTKELTRCNIPYCGNRC